MELSTVKRSVLFLKRKLIDRVIESVNYLGGDYGEHYPIGSRELESMLPVKVTQINSKGFTIYMKLIGKNDKELYLINCIKSSRWCTYFCSTSKVKFSVGGEDLYINDFYDTFVLKFVDKNVLSKELGNIGIDIFSKKFSLKKWREIVRKNTNKKISTMLSDQKNLGGCSNYVKNEVLYYASVFPDRVVGEIPDEKLDKIFEGLLIVPRMIHNAKNYNLYPSPKYSDNISTSYNVIHITDDFPRN
jgi:formamidopyrimidine-DNA glycosylase